MLLHCKRSWEQYSNAYVAMPLYQCLCSRPCISVIKYKHTVYSLFPLEIPRHPGEIQLSFYKIISMLLGNFIPI